ncbi:RadC family protein [Roseimaritima sediminicola]|uniref:RadC family protein n=1 Tax=Roseimaritima sediminicola TaxID=2662066 RepID=UPI00129831C4|nr:DNA repair protein RadC [Roseimaritima sediminicola]
MDLDQRRLRLQQVLDALIHLDDFSSRDVQQRCQEPQGGYVTRTLQDLVNTGVLEQQGGPRNRRFRWAVPRASFRPAVWIDQQLHGDQVRELPPEERPREKLLRDGPSTLSTAELLAILIRVGVRGESAVTGGRKLANRFATRLPELREHSRLELREITRAVTAANFCQIQAGIELGRRVAEAEIAARQNRQATKITSTSAAVAYCAEQFRYLANDATQEEFHIVTLDTKHKPIRTHRITVGTLDASLVHPREVFRPAIRDAASAVLLVHNHPSGDPTPSREDHQVTERLTEVGGLIGITVLDHIIVASENCLSIREVS